jgi:5-formyltetrahydrofolate cyclo-ligase
MVHASDASAKRALRLAVRDQRSTLSAAAPDAGARAAERLPIARFVDVRIVAGYRPLGGEIDPLPLMRRLTAAGARLALPVATARDAALCFRAYAPGDRLAPDFCGIEAPTTEAPLVRPDLVIVPLLAFDHAGGRIGQGGGHYDRTLAALRAEGPTFALGLAFAGQEVAAIPGEPHDQRLDAILTEMSYIEVN